MNILVFGSSILSCYWNGAATYYRGIYKELNRLGYRIVFAEPDAYGRQQHRDLEAFEQVTSVVYAPGDYARVLDQYLAWSDVLVKHSGVGVDDAELESAVLAARDQGKLVIFWDVDAPATLERVEENRSDPFRKLIPEYDAVLTYGGGPPVVEHLKRLGAQAVHPIYNGLDPETHHPVDAASEFACDLAFLGNRLPDRERRVEELFLRAASLAPACQFLLGGEGWADKAMPSNVRWIGHVPTALHNTVNCSARMVLNINRDSMAKVGFSPPTRVFEVAGSGACLLCDAWPGVETFFEPDKEIFVVSTAEEIVAHLHRPRPVAECAGKALRERALREHTYRQRAKQTDKILHALKRRRELIAVEGAVA
jgi:spore maturation protein CgeB